MSQFYITNEIGTPPVTLDRMKEYLRVDFTDDDQLITDLIKAATHTIEAHIDQYIIEREFTLMPDKITTGENKFDVRYITEVSSLWDYNVNPPVELTNTFTAYLYDMHFELNIDGELPNSDKILIKGKTAYPPTEDINIAIVWFTAHLYENRNIVVYGSASQLPNGIEYILNPHRHLKAG